MKNKTLKYGAWLLMSVLPFFTTTAHAVAVTAIAAGASGGTHTCALTIAGAVQCWGLNHVGQLGDRTTITPKLTPVKVKGLGNGATAIASGATHVCVLMKGGIVKCWGANYYGVLGDGTLTNSLEPVVVAGLSSGVTAITAGGYHNCALTSSGGVKCWGENEFGQLGDGTLIDKWTPVDVIGLSSGVAAVEANYYHTCALTTSGGVKCWGYNEYGQLGDNSITTDRQTPVDVTGLSSGVIAITVGSHHSCALTSAGAVKCWGRNRLFGSLGNGTAIDSSIPVNVTGLSSGVTAIAAGGEHTCALISGGVKCWGSNGWGQIGDGIATNDSRFTPVSVVGLSSGITAISAGYKHTCAITSAATMKCWGDNQYGQLGDGTTGDAQHKRLAPVDVLFDRVKNDYNNHGLAGWYWKGAAGDVATKNEIWRLAFPLQSSGWAVPTRSYPPQFADQTNWDIVTSGDFDNDSDTDVLWRNKSTAQWRVWQMQNGTRVAQNDLADFDLAHAWQVIGAGDTDKDGDDDVILNNTTTGEVLIWQMQNHDITASHNVGTKPGYVVNRVGDFNKDGDVDLLFRQSGGDALVIWEINSNAYVAEYSLGNTGTGYSPACAGDFDGDGDDDIMLLNTTTTQEKWIAIENYTRTQRFGSTNVGFAFISCGDYDGDGDADTLWQRTSDAITRVVLQQGVLTTAVKQTVYTNPYGGVDIGSDGYGFVYRGNSN